MLLDEVVEPGWLTKEQFYQGFALVQVCINKRGKGGVGGRG